MDLGDADVSAHSHEYSGLSVVVLLTLSLCFTHAHLFFTVKAGLLLLLFPHIYISMFY